VTGEAGEVPRMYRISPAYPGLRAGTLFIENIDFVCFPNPESKNGRGGHNQIDYFVNTDMAKELCMVENNEEGRECRRYFIESACGLRRSQRIVF
jgi:phage anti-repressor protein